MIERLQVDLQIIEGKDPYIDMCLNDKCNDAYGMMFSTVMFAAPLIGSNLFIEYGSRLTFDYVAIANLALAVVFLVFNCGFDPIGENKRFQRRLTKLRMGKPLNLSESLDVSMTIKKALSERSRARIKIGRQTSQIRPMVGFSSRSHSSIRSKGSMQYRDSHSSRL